MTKFVTLTFTREELADALCHTSLLSVWDERADAIIDVLATATLPGLDYACARIGRDVRLELVAGADVSGRLAVVIGNNRQNATLTIEGTPENRHPDDIVPLRNVTRIWVRG